MNLETSLTDFLKSKQKLVYDTDKAEPGFVGLCDFSSLQEEKIWIEGPTPSCNYYEIPAVNLTCENEFYDPEFILCWLPNEKCYATWDSDHWILYLFIDASWQDIVENPLQFINCQWDYTQTIGHLFDPEGKYELIEGWPI